MTVRARWSEVAAATITMLFLQLAFGVSVILRIWFAPADDEGIGLDSERNVIEIVIPLFFGANEEIVRFRGGR